MYVKVQKKINFEEGQDHHPYILLSTEGEELNLLIAQSNYQAQSTLNKDQEVFLCFTNYDDWPEKEIEEVTTSIPADQWIKLTPDPKELNEVKIIIQKIRNRLDTNEPKIFKYTLVYLLLKLKWMYIFKRLRVRADGLISEKMISLLHHMKLNHTKNRSVNYYAKSISVSDNYLGELCRNEINLTYREISSLLLTIRILDLFYVSKMNFSEITDHLGFADQAHFSNFFKKEMNVTPSQFRRGVLI